MENGEDNQSQQIPIGILFFLQNVLEKLNKIDTLCDEYKENIWLVADRFEKFSCCCSAIKRMTEQQIMFPEDLTYDFAMTICDADSVETVVENYFFENNARRVENIITKCIASLQSEKYCELFVQIIDAYNRHSYHLACIGLFAIADGLLTDISYMQESTSFSRRVANVRQKLSDQVELESVDRRVFFLQLQLESLGDRLSNSIFGQSEFSKIEPNSLNRHWVMHGRTRKTYNQYDFLKILLWINQLIFLGEIIGVDTGGGST